MPAQEPGGTRESPREVEAPAGFLLQRKECGALPLAARALYSLTMASRLMVEVARGWGSSSGENQPTSVLSSSPTKGAASSSVGEQMKRMSMYRHWSPFAYFTR